MTAPVEFRSQPLGAATSSRPRSAAATSGGSIAALTSSATLKAAIALKRASQPPTSVAVAWVVGSRTAQPPELHA